MGLRSGAPATASTAIAGPLRELERANGQLFALASRRAVNESRATHDVEPFERLHAAFPGTNVDEPLFFAAAMADPGDATHRYVAMYGHDGDAGIAAHVAQVRRHAAEIEYQQVLANLGTSSIWEPLRTFARSHPDLHLEEPAVFERARTATSL